MESFEEPISEPFPQEEVNEMVEEKAGQEEEHQEIQNSEVNEAIEEEHNISENQEKPQEMSPEKSQEQDMDFPTFQANNEHPPLPSTDLTQPTTMEIEPTPQTPIQEPPHSTPQISIQSPIQQVQQVQESHKKSIEKEEIFNSEDEEERKKAHFTAEANIALAELKEAIRSGNVELVESLLITHQAQYNIANRIDPATKQISLFFLPFCKDEKASCEILDLLLKHGCDGSFKDSLKQNVLFYFSRDGRLDLIKKLEGIAHCVDLDVYGQTPLYYCCREGHIDVVKYFVEQGCNVNQTDSISNQSPLFYAAREGRVDICQYLLEKGANPNHYDSKRQTALNWARKHNRKAVIELLKNSASAGVSKEKIEKVEKEKSQSERVKAEDELSSKKRKREKNEAKIAYKLVFTNEQGNSTDVSAEDFETFKAQYSQLAALLTDPDSSLTDNMLSKISEAESWEKVAKKILNYLWKLRGGNLFHMPVDPIKLNIEDYFDIVKYPMDFGSIKTKLNKNVYQSAADFSHDMELVFNNCILYNGAESEVGKICAGIQKEWWSQVNVNGFKDFYGDSSRGGE